MSAVRRSQSLNDADKEGVLSVLGEARRSLIAARQQMRPKSGLSRSADALICEIDEFAHVLTGAEDYFHLKAHGTPARRERRVVLPSLGDVLAHVDSAWGTFFRSRFCATGHSRPGARESRSTGREDPIFWNQPAI